MEKEIKPYIVAIAGFFFGSIMLGSLVASQNMQEARLLTERISTFDFIKQFSPFFIFLLIFLNNALKAFFVILFGFFFGLAPLIFIFFNGYIIGIVIAVTVQKVGAWPVIVGLLPHGILEIPAVLLAASYGLWLGVKFYRRLRYHELFKPRLIYAIKRFFKLILPLLFIAAIIETYVTSYLLKQLR